MCRKKVADIIDEVGRDRVLEMHELTLNRLKNGMLCPKCGSEVYKFIGTYWESYTESEYPKRQAELYHCLECDVYFERRPSNKLDEKHNMKILSESEFKKVVDKYD